MVSLRIPDVPRFVPFTLGMSSCPDSNTRCDAGFGNAVTIGAQRELQEWIPVGSP